MSRGEIPEQEGVFCFILKSEIWKIEQWGRDKTTFILSVYVLVWLRTMPVHHTTAWGYCFSVHFCKAFPDARFWMNGTSLTLFLYSALGRSFHHSFTVVFGGLAANI